MKMPPYFLVYFFQSTILNLTKKITFIVTEWFYMKSIKFIRKDFFFSDKEAFYEVVRLRKKMAVARLGYT